MISVPLACGPIFKTALRFCQIKTTHHANLRRFDNSDVRHVLRLGHQLNGNLGGPPEGPTGGPKAANGNSERKIHRPSQVDRKALSQPPALRTTAPTSAGCAPCPNTVSTFRAKSSKGLVALGNMVEPSRKVDSFEDLVERLGDKDFESSLSKQLVARARELSAKLRDSQKTRKFPQGLAEQLASYQD